ncbi:MAG: Maf family protein [Acidithiobacillus sp.]
MPSPDASGTPALTLASASPRRLELLRQLGYAPRVRVAAVDETPHPTEGPQTLVRRLARDKALAVWHALPEGIVLAADTVVVQGEQIFGKPRDFAEAQRMYAALGGRWHRVLTAVAIYDGQRWYRGLSRSAVLLRPLSRAEAAAYWASGEPWDKAGAYGIQGLGASFVQSLRGSYSGVMGLPLYETATLLRAVGLSPPFLRDRHE